MSDDEIRMAVMRGQLSPDNLPSQRTAKARADAELEAWRKSGKREEVYRDVPGEGRISVPQHVLDAEAKDPEHRQRVFMRRLDSQGYPWSGWQLPAPPKPQRVQEAEIYFKRNYVWDPILTEYVAETIHQRPPLMAAVDEHLDPDDNRRSRYDHRSGRWYFPSEEDHLGQTPREREDLVSPSGFPMTGPSGGVGRGYSHIMGTTEEDTPSVPGKGKRA